MHSNSLKLKELNDKLKKSNTKNINLEKNIELLNNRLNQKYSELMELNQKLLALKAQVSELEIAIVDLSSENKAQADYIDNKITELHTAYYIVGTSKDLVESKLIDKSGGLLGIGKTAKLSNDLDPNMFVKIDYLQTTAIAINSKHVKIITSHPTDSYSFDKTGNMINNLMISDPEKFWSASKYLVITK
jgi:septal ring factor EnvC (AmiA/AmiB activator)